jgi:hypothetical protein
MRRVFNKSQRETRGGNLQEAMDSLLQKEKVLFEQENKEYLLEQRCKEVNLALTQMKALISEKEAEITRVREE